MAQITKKTISNSKFKNQIHLVPKDETKINDNFVTEKSSVDCRYRIFLW